MLGNLVRYGAVLSFDEFLQFRFTVYLFATHLVLEYIQINRTSASDTADIDY
jgi:hypothetical protein